MGSLSLGQSGIAGVIKNEIKAKKFSSLKRNPKQIGTKPRLILKDFFGLFYFAIQRLQNYVKNPLKISMEIRID
jgi:hypothetical protein